MVKLSILRKQSLTLPSRPCPAKRGKVGQRTFMVSVYILQSLKDNGFYIGICKDLQNRLNKHNKGGVSSTKNRRPFIYSEKFSDYLTARIREREIKSYKGSNEFKKLIGT